jgi:protein-tyrosine-phosphatase
MGVVTRPIQALAARAAALAALGDPARLTIADLLTQSDLSPDSLAAALHLPTNLLAHHLKVLEQAGLITRKQSDHDRRRTYCHLETSALTGLLPGATVATPHRVVFVCKHNSARSVLAEALWASLSEIPTASAGTAPASQINPLTLPAAKRAGLVLKSNKPKPLEIVLSEHDLVVSVCDVANEQLPQLSNQRLHWSLPDPAATNKPDAFDKTVGELRERVARLAPTLSKPAKPATSRATKPTKPTTQPKRKKARQ